MDSSVSPTHGEQEMSVWNGHYACTCYHPLFVFNQFGDLEGCALRADFVAKVTKQVLWNWNLIQLNRDECAFES
jgi:hypothetical protein